jgi:hypothetical protein
LFRDANISITQKLYASEIQTQQTKLFREIDGTSINTTLKVTSSPGTKGSQEQEKNGYQAMVYIA